MNRSRPTKITLIAVFGLAFLPAMASAQILVEASPSNYNFGDVVIGAPVEQTFVLTNVGTDIGVIETIQLTVNHVFTLLGTIQGIELYPASWTSGQSSTEVTIVFNPDVVGDFASTILIRYDDGWPQSLVIPLSGRGVLVEPTIDPQVEATVTELDAAVDVGTVVGSSSGGGGSSDAHLNAFREHLLAASDLFLQGDLAAACDALGWILLRCDGVDKPKDFIEGEDAVLVYEMVNDMLVERCGG